MITILNNSQDFINLSCSHPWVKEPMKYPCLAVGVWFDDTNGAADYDYEFVNLKKDGEQYIIDDLRI